MKTIKTENAKIKIELARFNEAGDLHLVVHLNSDQNPVIAIVSYQIVKTKFTDAAFTRHILNFLIKD
jgi:hypothetical protein